MRRHSRTLLALAGLVLLPGCALERGIMPITQERLLIASYRETCSGDNVPAYSSCLQVKNAPEDAWRDWFDPIEGFTHELGYNYEIIVDVYPVNLGATDGPDNIYRLRRLVRKTVVASVVAARSVDSLEVTPLTPDAR